MVINKSSMKALLLATCVLVVVSLSAIGCGQQKVDTSKEVYKIGAVLSLSGPAAPLGQPEQRAMMLLQDQLNAGAGINGHKVEFIFEDDQSQPEMAKTAITKLINTEKVPGVLGSSSTGATLAMAPVAQSSKIPMICCAAGTKITSPVMSYVFRTPPTDAMAITKVLQYLKAQNIKQIAILHDANAFGTGGADELQAKASKYGVKVVARESYGSTDTDMTAQLTKIKGTPAEAVVVWGTNPGPASIAKNMQQLQMTIPFIGSHGIANQKFIELAGEAANGVIFPAGKLLVWQGLAESDPQKAVLKAYAESFQAKYGRSADTFGGHAYDALSMLVKALEQAGGDKAKIRDALESVKGFVGTGGVFNMSATDHNGLGKGAFVMIVIKDGKWSLAD